MNKEIERKFLVNEIPNLDCIIPIRYERYFLNDDVINQIRIQRKNNLCEIETKTKVSKFEYIKEKKNISESEFNNLIKQCSKSIIIDSYLINENPETTLKIYHGTYEGLIRVEVEFHNIKEAEEYTTPDWFGKEISNKELGLDAKLIQLCRQDFLKLLNKYSCLKEKTFMNKEEFIKYGLTKKGAREDFKIEWNAARLLIEDKMFAMICEDKEGKPIFTLKCNPELAELYRKQYKDVIPGYYMNKTHWNSIYIGGDVPDSALKEMLDMSYNLILESLPKKIKEQYK